MKRQQAFKYELKPSVEQQRRMVCYTGCRRAVYNKALALQQANHEAGNKFICYETMAKNLVAWRADEVTIWLAEAPFHTLQQSLQDMEKAFENFFAKRAEFPRFKKKGQSDSFRYPDPKQIKLDQANDRIFLPKLGWLRYRNSREVLGSVRNVTVSGLNGKWFISIQTAREVELPVPKGDAVGVDMGIVRFATLSDETVIPSLNLHRQHAPTLRKAQQALSRKKKFSSSWKKAKAKVQRIHVRIANARRDFLHKASTTISKNHAMVVVEDLQVSNMSRSAAGTEEQPGRNVKQKSGLNRSILDQGWAEFRRQLEYKVLWQGGLFLAVPPHNTSRTCPHCGHISGDNRKSQADFACVACGFHENADRVGA
ncbi:MAG: transposase, partial [Terriglobia bacterium]|nr:transposase [Terriglobia bacterium]